VQKDRAAGTERDAAGRGPTLAPAVDARWQSEGAMSHTGAEPSEEPKSSGHFWLQTYPLRALLDCL
jgi:hypothetical protein